MIKKYQCTAYGCVPCMKNGCCKDCKKFESCDSRLKCFNSPDKCGQHIEVTDVDMRYLMRN